MRLLVLFCVAPLLGQQGATAPTLDYQFFKEKVEPVFLKKRPGHARCIVCHEHGSPPLAKLDPGAAFFTEEQSRKNFEMWKLFVKPGNPSASPMLLHPLAVKAGGDRFHAGGKHWQSKEDPEWQTLARWVNGEKLTSSN